jgi:hypothetical protein
MIFWYTPDGSQVAFGPKPFGEQCMDLSMKHHY